MKTSKEIAEKMNVAHSELMDFYWHLEEMIVTNRNFIKCCLVIDDEGNWRDDSYNIFCAKDYMTNDMVSSYNYSDWLPATEEEYLNYIKTIN